VVEMNMGQILHAVRLAVHEPDRVFLINRVDGELITDADIKKTLRIIQGKGA
jgi:2-oxoglutarate ferredoxin oxidoreductase subunit alpha